MNSKQTEIRNAIEKMAQIVRTALGITEPIGDMRNVVSQLHGECVAQDGLDYDAKIVVTNASQFRVEYDSTQSPQRINFSIAHELGHLFMHLLDNDGKFIENQAYYRGKYGSPYSAEWEANEFAAAFLMPEKEFKAFFYCQTQTADTVDVAIIADHFCVSKQAATVRGRVLGLW